MTPAWKRDSNRETDRETDDERDTEKERERVTLSQGIPHFNLISFDPCGETVTGIMTERQI